MIDALMLDYRAVSEKTGIKVAVLQKYLSEARKHERAGGRRPGDFPEPDRYYGSTPMWKASTINAWTRSRPGRGAGGGRPRKDSSPTP